MPVGKVLRTAAVLASFLVYSTSGFFASRTRPLSLFYLQPLGYSKSGIDSENSLSESPSRVQLVSASMHRCSPNAQLDRRKAFVTLSTTLVTGALATTAKRADALDRTFPDELTVSDPQTITLGSRLNSQQRATAAAATAKANKSNLQNFNLRNDLGPSLAWGTALWLLSGSRSNPLATPLANLLYDENKEGWLKDRNDGLFAPPPFVFLFILACVFAGLGVLAQFLLLQLAEGDSDVCLQLAGVSLIGGATLELGRIASGEKRSTREEMDRSNRLQAEFAEFVNKRLTSGGNCHRKDIVAAFRRYFAKYRQADSEECPLTDLEIEQLLRSWNQNENQGRAEMTSGGFYYGIQINKEADAFA